MSLSFTVNGPRNDPVAKQVAAWNVSVEKQLATKFKFNRVENQKESFVWGNEIDDWPKEKLGWTEEINYSRTTGGPLLVTFYNN